MSVRTHTYIIFGINLDPDAIETIEDPFEATESLQGDWRKPPRRFNEVSVVYDGMSGNFLLVGFILARTDETGHFDEVHSLERFSDTVIEEFQKRITDTMAECGITIDPQTKPRWHVVTHYH
jgi:hypothetical protein